MVRKLAADVVIVGGGIVGLSTALELRQRGRSVVVAERGMMGAEASGRNGGGVRQQGRVLPEIPFAMGAVKVWKELDGLLDQPTGYRQIGHLYVAESDQDMEKLSRQREQEMALGLESELIDAKAARQLAPGLSSHIVGAKLCQTDGYADPALSSLCIALTAENAGATILCHSPVTAIGTRNGRVATVTAGDTIIETDCVLNAAGPWAPAISQMVEAYLPIYPSRSVLVLTEPMPLQMLTFVQTAAQDLGSSQFADGSVRLGGGTTPNDVNRFTFSKRLEPDPDPPKPPKAEVVFPALRNAKVASRWVGIRECTPDMMPIMGPVGGPDGFLVAAGFSGHGFCLGPYAGRLMAEWIVDGAPSFDLSAFSHSRFLRAEGPLSVIKVAPEQTG